MLCDSAFSALSVVIAFVMNSRLLLNSFSVGLRWKAIWNDLVMRSSVDPIAMRLAKAMARASTKGLFIKNRACWGTLVRWRCGLWSSGLAKSKARSVLGKNWRSMRP